MEIDEVIKQRKTEKVLAAEPWEVSVDNAALAVTVDELLKLAAAAPYHKKCHESHLNHATGLTSCVPWRFYTLDTANCRKLYDFIEQAGIKAGKISNMLAAADGLLMVTWLPDPPEEEKDQSEVHHQEPVPFIGNIRNMEHIAASSAAIQNVLIGATARDIPNYWSSGGQLRNAQLREHLNIPLSEILLGAIFLFPQDTHEREVTIKAGALREQGKEKSTWSKWVTVNDNV